jgi:hypothetical protein
MKSFLGLYRGQTIADAKLIAVSADPTIVAEFVDILLGEPDEREDDPIRQQMVRNRRAILHLILQEAEADEAPH